MSTKEKFLAEIERFLRRSGMSAKEFGDKVMNDVSYVYRLRKGRVSSADTMDRVKAWIAEHKAGGKSRPSQRAA
ncbi:MAG: hypothetical protein AB1781_11105 [Pseudomonadota bacterium]